MRLEMLFIIFSGSLLVMNEAAEAITPIIFSNVELRDEDGADTRTFALDVEALKPCPDNDNDEDEPFREVSTVAVDVKNNLSVGVEIENIRWRVPGIGKSQKIDFGFSIAPDEEASVEFPISVTNADDDGKILFGSSRQLTALGYRTIRLLVTTRDGRGVRRKHKIFLGVHFDEINRCPEG